MRGGFSNELDWLTPSLGFTVWAGHFLLLWSASSIFPGHGAARWVALGLTIVAMASLVLIWRVRQVGTVRSVAGLGIAISAVAILFSVLPAIVG